MLDFSDFVNYFFPFPFEAKIGLQKLDITPKVSELVNDFFPLASGVESFFLFC